MLKLIAKSNTYRLSSQFPGEWKASYEPYFARKFVRRLKAEEIYDSLVSATNIFTDVPIRGTDVKVKFATEAYSPDEFIRNVKTIDLRGDSFLTHRSARRTGNPQTSNDGAITQAVLLMNSQRSCTARSGRSRAVTSQGCSSNH